MSHNINASLKEIVKDYEIMPNDIAMQTEMIENRLSRVSARLSDITTLLQMSHSSAAAIIVELQCEIEDIYISIERNDIAAEQSEVYNGTEYL